MLRRGAKLVYAVDVGTAQLHESLREDTRVISMENTNILMIAPCSLTPAPDFVSIDVSFVSAANILPQVARLITFSGQALVLVKPQFECGKKSLSKRGIVRDEKTRLMAVGRITAAGSDVGLRCRGTAESVLKGGDGNTEYFVHFTRDD